MKQRTFLKMKINYTTTCCKNQLGKIRNFVSEQISTAQLSEIEKNQVILAVDEACANAIIHGNNCDEKRELKLALDVNQERIYVEIHDVGNFRPNEVNWSSRDLIRTCVKNKRKGGLGLNLMHRIMDSVQYYNNGKINVCALTKEIR